MISGPEAVARSARSFSECASDSGHYIYIIVISLTFVKCFLEKSSALPGQTGAKLRQNEEDAERKKKLAGFVRGPAGHPEEQRREKTRNLPGIYPAQQSAARCTTGAGSTPSQSSASTRSVSSHKKTPLVRMCFFPVYTPAGQKGRGNLPSCKLHLDFRRRIRYNIYVIHTTEYAGVSEWQTRGTQNPLRHFEGYFQKVEDSCGFSGHSRAPKTEHPS